MDQLDLVELAQKSARASDPVTSHIAAKKAVFRASQNQILVLKHLSERAMTDFELAAATGLIPTSIGKRRKECMEPGYVVAALDGRGELATRKNERGSAAIIWQITPAGQSFYAQHRR